MKKSMKKWIMIGCAVLAVILGFVALVIVSQPKINRTWKLDFAVPPQLRSHIKDGGGGKVAISTPTRKNDYAYVLKDIDIVMEANGGEITLTDNINDIIYTGTYDKNNSITNDYYNVVVDGFGGRAYLSTGPKLRINLDGYELQFRPTEVSFLDRFNEWVMDFIQKYSGIMVVCLFELMIVVTVVSMTRRSRKEMSQLEDEAFERTVRCLALKPFIFNVVTFIIMGGSYLASALIELGALLGILLAFWMALVTVLVGPSVCVQSFIYSIAYTKRLPDTDKGKGIKYIVISVFSALLTLAVLAIMVGMLADYLHW